VPTDSSKDPLVALVELKASRFPSPAFAEDVVNLDIGLMDVEAPATRLSWNWIKAWVLLLTVAASPTRVRNSAIC